ncbi:MAG: AAA family ATPase [Micromonosporaceae bacterium]|jgi:DNA-binding CsgD family transcriptional regulator
MVDDEVPESRVVAPALVGREEELGRLAAAVSSPPSVVVVEGEAGIGKTRLVTELARRPEMAGRRLLTGRCHRMRESFPLGPVIEAVRGLGDDLARVRLSAVVGALRPLLPEVAHLLPPTPEPLSDRVAERHRVFRGLTDLLAALGPTVLVLEDLHWADEQTADFVGYVLAEGLPDLSLVLTFRGEEVDPAVRALPAKLPDTTTRTDVVLGPLDEAATGALAAAIMGVDRVSEEFAAYLCERASGLPFAIEELVALLRARGTLVRRGRSWARRTLAELDVPVRIRDSVLERVSRLSDAARAVVEAAAVLQVSVPAAVVEAVSGTPDARAGIAEALGSGLLAEDGAAVGFRHLLAAQAVYEDLPGPRRQELHARAATALSDTEPVPLGQVAHHLRYAGQLAEWVVAAERAADQALALGHDAEAARLLEEVLRQVSLDADTAGRLAVKLATCAVDALRSKEVIGLLSDVLRRDLPRSVRGELRFRLALQLHEVGDDLERARRLCAEAVDELDDRPDLQAWAMVVLGIPVVDGVPVSECRQWLQRALETLPRVADPTFQTFLLGKIAMVLIPIGDPVWHRLRQDIEERTGGRPGNRAAVNAYWSVGAQACYAGHLAVSRRMLTAALEGAVSGENRRLQLCVRSGLALLDYCTGRWAALDDSLDAVIEELSGDPRAWLDVRVAADCLRLLRSGSVEAYRALAGTVAHAVELGGVDLVWIPASVWLRFALSRGDVAAAAGEVDRLLGILVDKGVWAPGMRALPAMTEVLIAAGDLSRARELVDRFANAVRDLDAPLATAGVPYSHGHLERAAGDLTAAVERFTTAAARYAELGCPYEAAQAREHAALTLFDLKEDAAGPTLLAALATYRDLNAGWDTARVTQVARAAGLPVPARHRGGRRGYGRELSPREREVAELAAGGRSNKEIAALLYLSVNTVARHLTAAMRKLDVRSRAAIAHRLAELQKRR